VWLAFITQNSGRKIVKQRKTGATIRVILVALAMMAFCAPVMADAGGDIRALEERFVAALKAKDVDATMKVYAPDQTLVVFDVVPPRQMSALQPAARTGKPSSTASRAPSPSS